MMARMRFVLPGHGRITWRSLTILSGMTIVSLVVPGVRAEQAPDGTGLSGLTESDARYARSRFIAAKAIHLERFVGLAKLVQYEDAAQMKPGEPADPKPISGISTTKLGRLVLHMKDAPQRFASSSASIVFPVPAPPEHITRGLASTTSINLS